jgi:hypothetical protein
MVRFVFMAFFIIEQSFYCQEYFTRFFENVITGLSSLSMLKVIS